MPSRLTPLAKALRKNSTDAENLLWRQLRAKRFGSHKFKRQQPLGKFIVDFVCFDVKLVIELDGGQHADRVDEDAERTRWLASQGFRVLRFWNNEVIENLEGVWANIMAALSPSPPPSPLEGEGENRSTE